MCGNYSREETIEGRKLYEVICHNRNLGKEENYEEENVYQSGKGKKKISTSYR